MTARDGEWDSVKQWFHAALERPAPDRSNYLDDALRERPALLREVRSLLAAHEEGAARFERG
ncbi:MAG: hypothetical protein IPP90_19245 [Gemmatimonadaceae bacterium]|nr:hypothetical protein [Gemmatimonadaceae bacterium]